MRKAEIQAWALSVVDQVAQQQRVEDAHAECKRDWVDPAKAARQIAAACNAARGAQVLWIVGLDEKSGVCGASPAELSNWWSAVQSKFESVAPALNDVTLQAEGKTLTLLLFDSDLAPYVVANSAGGPIQFEVPWRDGTRTRSARRDDLLRLLAPIPERLALELLSAHLSARVENTPRGQAHYLRGFVEVYVDAPPAYAVVPDHRNTGGVTIGRKTFEADLTVVRPSSHSSRIFLSHSGDSRLRTIHTGIDQCIFDGPGYASVDLHVPLTKALTNAQTTADTARLIALINPTRQDLPTRLEITMTHTEGEGVGWTYDAQSERT